MNRDSSRKNIFTVSQLNRLARSVLESEVGQIWLTAEISNFVAAASGHWYFTLKDNKAQIKAAMFRGANMRVKTRPVEGDKLLVRATVGIYEARGDYQIVVDFMEPDGEGQLKQQFELLKIKLASEGLFATTKKQALPDIVRTIGIVTSSTGAALHDVLTVLKRRDPSMSIVIYPSQVQGELAPKQLCQAIERAVLRNEVDVLLVGRGGGSLEDLWCFNDENVARTLFACPIPTISAVGHEVDVTIADFVADLRAPTPSAAAELVSSDQAERFQETINLQQRLFRAVQKQLNLHRNNHQLAEQKLKQTHPQNRISQQYQHLDNLNMSLAHSFTRYQAKRQHDLSLKSQRLDRVSPINQIRQDTQKIAHNEQQFRQAMLNILSRQQLRAAKACQLLDTVSPLATLSRGYSITFKDDEVIKQSGSLQSGDKITTQFSDGNVVSIVTED